MNDQSMNNGCPILGRCVSRLMNVQACQGVRGFQIGTPSRDLLCRTLSMFFNAFWRRTHRPPVGPEESLVVEPAHPKEEEGNQRRFKAEQWTEQLQIPGGTSQACQTCFSAAVQRGQKCQKGSKRVRRVRRGKNGSEGSKRGQKGQKRIKKGQKGSKRVRRFKKGSTYVRRVKKGQTGQKGQKGQKGSEGSKRVQKSQNKGLQLWHTFL